MKHCDIPHGKEFRLDWLACSWATPYFQVPWRCLVVVHSCARLLAGRLDGILRVSRSLCRGCLRNPLVREVCVGLSRGEGLGNCQGLGRRGGRRAGGRESRILPGVPGWQYGGPVTSGRCRVVGLSVVAGSLLSVVARSWVVVALSSRSPRWILIALSSVCKSPIEASQSQTGSSLKHLVVSQFS